MNSYNDIPTWWEEAVKNLLWLLVETDTTFLVTSNVGRYILQYENGTFLIQHSNFLPIGEISLKDYDVEALTILITCFNYNQIKDCIPTKAEVKTRSNALSWRRLNENV